MTTVWTPDPKLQGQASATYDTAALTYDQVTENYDGQMTTTWTDDTRN